MRLLARYLIILGTAFIVTACGSAAPKYPIPEPVGSFDPSTEAMVLFNAFIVDDDGDLRWMKLYWQKEGTPLNQYQIYSREGDTARPFVHRLQPGRYVFILLSEDVLVKPQEPLPIITFDPDRHIPLTPIDVQAGDVIYAGNLLAHNLRYKQTLLGRIPQDSDIRLEIADRSDKAREVISEYYPELADDLETHLIQVLQ